MQSNNFAQLPFRQASQIWLGTRTHISDRTRHDYQQYFTALNHYFGNVPLESITLDHLWDYQKKRNAGNVAGLKKAGNTRTNHEMNGLTQVLDYAGLWDKMKKWFNPLPVPLDGIGMAITPQEEECLFRTASRSNRWLVAYCCSMITVNTTAGPGEIRNLRLRDVDLEAREIRIVGGAKNKHRVRDIPLNDHASWAVGILVARAKEKGSTLPEHYLLPHRANSRDGSADPARPMGSWKKAWGSLRAEAGRFYPRLSKLRMYDLRHQIITKLLEDPSVPEGTVKALAGHVSERILNRYSHIRTQSKRAAVDALLKEPVNNAAAPSEPQAVIRKSTPRPSKPKAVSFDAICSPRPRIQSPQRRVISVEAHAQIVRLDFCSKIPYENIMNMDDGACPSKVSITLRSIPSMIRAASFVPLLLLASFLSAQSHVLPPPVGGITFDQVIRLSQSGLPDTVIIAQIKKRPEPFALTPDEMLQLKSAQVSDQIIEAMAGPAPLAIRASSPSARVVPKPSPPVEPGVYLASAKGNSKVIGQVITFDRTGSLLVSHLTLGVKAAHDNVQLLGPHANLAVDGRPVFYFIPSKQQADNGVDAGDLVLVRLEEKLERRQFEIAARGDWRASDGISITHQVPIARAEESAGVYSIKPAGTLRRGEYAIYLVRGDGLKAYIYDFSSNGE